MSIPRGVFHHERRARQLIRFDGLRWGNITPTDFDLFLDFGGRAFVFGEFKYSDAPLHRGQELALERVASACDRAGIATLVFVASHNIDIGDVFAIDARVIRVLWHGRWLTRDHGSVGEVVTRFHDKYVRRAA